MDLWTELSILENLCSQIMEEAYYQNCPSLFLISCEILRLGLENLNLLDNFGTNETLCAKRNFAALFYGRELSLSDQLF